MPDTQILNSSNAVNTTITTTEANTKTVQKPPGTPHSEALSSKTPTFSDSLQQALDEANVVQQDRIEQTVDGNDLPLVDEMNENVAEDDLSFITVNLTNTDNPTLFLQSVKGISDETKGVLQNSMLSEQIAIDKADVEKPLIPLQTATTNTIVASSVLSTLNTKQMKLALNDSAQTTLSNNAVEDKHVTQQFKQLSSQSNENTLQTNAFSGLDKNELLTNKNQFLNLIEQHQSPLKNATTMMLNTSSNLVDTSANASPITLAIAPASTTEINLSSVIKPEITTTVGRQGWSQGMGKQILWMVNQNINSAEIRLNPAHLGPVEVRIDMQGDQINLALSSHHAAVREAMEAALPKLREMLDDTGFKLAGADISGQTFAEQRQSTFSDNNFDADKKQNSNGVTGMNIDATLSSNNDTHVLLNDAVSSAVDLYV